MSAAIAELRATLTAAADPARAPAMRAYMRERFDFLGVATPQRRKLATPWLRAQACLDEAELLTLAEALWREPAREFQYVALDLLDRYAAKLSAAALPRLEALVVDKAWWDSVDGLAAWVIGVLVRAERGLQTRMDELSGADDFWLRRVAILHQLYWQADTDAARLFDYCRRNAGEQEFFIRKAIGWALRQYAYTDAAAVRAFVDTTPLAPLSRREALKHLV